MMRRAKALAWARKIFPGNILDLSRKSNGKVKAQQKAFCERVFQIRKEKQQSSSFSLKVDNYCICWNLS
jgi:hypothetical protein